MNTKQINKDWTLRGDRSPRKKDVVVDINSILGIVMKTEGEFGKKKLWVNDINNKEIHSGVPTNDFKICNRDQTSDFFLEYKTNIGWIKDKIYTIKGKDYPLLLVDLKYDLVKQDMLYVFKDLTAPVVKYVKTHSESLVENIPSWLTELTTQSFEADTDRLRISKVSSALSETERTWNSMIALNIQDNTLYITTAEHHCGQPAIFNSRVAAAVALMTVGESTWINVLRTI